MLYVGNIVFRDIEGLEMKLLNSLEYVPKDAEYICEYSGTNKRLYTLIIGTMEKYT